MKSKLALIVILAAMVILAFNAVYADPGSATACVHSQGPLHASETGEVNANVNSVLVKCSEPG